VCSGRDVLLFCLPKQHIPLSLAAHSEANCA
jgi:hypothetical protein